MVKKNYIINDKSLQILIDKNNELNDYIDDNLIVLKHKTAQRTVASCIDLSYPKNSLDDKFELLDLSFQQKLFKLIDEKQLSDIDVYKNAHIDRRLFSKIRSDIDFRPSKKTVISLCFGLQLYLDEASDLLDSAGYSLSHSSKFDLVVEFFLENQIFDITIVNQALYERGLALLYV